MADVTFRFSGVSNKQTPNDLGVIDDLRSPLLSWLVSATDVDISDTQGMAGRPGYTLHIAGTPHSGWALADGTRAFFVSSGTLYEMIGSTSIPLIALASNDPVAFTQVNGVIVFTNGRIVGVVEGTNARLFGTPSSQYKLPMPAGHILAFFQGSLWVASSNVITRSDAYDIEQTDERLATFPMPERVTMMHQAGDAGAQGIWISCGGMTAFMRAGDEAFETKLPYGAVEGTATHAKGEWFKSAGLSGNVVVWRSQRGVCVGDGSGNVVNLSEKHVAMKPGRRGAAIVRHRQGQVHYISTVQDTSEEFNIHS